MEIGVENSSFRIQRANGTFEKPPTNPLWNSHSFFILKKNKEILENKFGEKDLQIIKVSEMRIV